MEENEKFLGRVKFNKVLGEVNADKISAGGSKTDAITINYDKSGKFRVLGIQTRFKAGLEDCTIIIRNESTSTEIVDGNVQLSQIGNTQDAQVPRDELPVDFTLLQGMVIKVSLSAKNKDINPGDVNVTLFGYKPE